MPDVIDSLFASELADTKFCNDKYINTEVLDKKIKYLRKNILSVIKIEKKVLSLFRCRFLHSIQQNDTEYTRFKYLIYKSILTTLQMHIYYKYLSIPSKPIGIDLL